MITFPPAKINLGLNVVERRPDGYHNLETVFYPVRLTDALEVLPMHRQFPTNGHYSLAIVNFPVEGDPDNNLVSRAQQLLRKDFPDLPRVHAHLYKGIPTQAGMGGGSSDGAYMIRMLNEMFNLGLSQERMMAYAVRLGADCPFFIQDGPAYAEGIGERLTPIELDLKGYHLAIVKPPIPVSTKEAFSLIKPHRPKKNCLDIVRQPMETWRYELENDFEQSVFALHPEIGAVKKHLYDMGAVYSAMSGSGSAVFAFFRTKDIPHLYMLDEEPDFKDMYTQIVSVG